MYQITFLMTCQPHRSNVKFTTFRRVSMISIKVGLWLINYLSWLQWCLCTKHSPEKRIFQKKTQLWYFYSHFQALTSDPPFGGKSKIKLNGKPYCWLTIDVKNRKIIGTFKEEKAAVFSIKGNAGKSLSEALIFTSANPQYDDRLFIELQVQYMKIPSSNLGRTYCVQKLSLTFRTILVRNMFWKKKSFWQRFTCTICYVYIFTTSLLCLLANYQPKNLKKSN